MTDLTVVCFFWHDPQAKCRHIYVYTPEHVYLLRRMVQRHLKMPHKFVCVTDQPEKFKGMHTVKMDRRTFVPGTRYGKLMMWRTDAGSLIGERMLYLDLDCVITRDITPIASRTEDVVLWRNPNFTGPEKRRARYNTSIMLITAGARPHVYHSFRPDFHPKDLRTRWGGTDQAWISECLSWTDEAYWTDADGVYGAGRLRDVVPGVGTALPDNARIVFFPGSREPGMPEIKAKHPWIKDHLY